MQALPAALLAGSALTGYALTAQALFTRAGFWIDLVRPMLTGTAIFIAQTVFRFMTEEKRARAVRAIFSSYAGPRIVEES